MKEIIAKWAERPLWLFGKWLLLSVLMGTIAGLAGTLFHFVLEEATILREENQWLLFFLPVAGIMIAASYHYLAGEKDKGTNMVLTAVRSNEPMPAVTAPLIFITTAFTHLCGGSAGREGAALQLGGSLASQLGSRLHLDEKDNRVLVMCGMSAAFSALFGTPVTAAVFSMEMVSVGVMYFSAIVPCMVASLTGFLVAGAFGVPPTIFSITKVPAVNMGSVGLVIVLGVLCAGLSIVFCESMHKSSHYLKKWFPNIYIRIAVGGCAIILLTLLEGSGDYNGAGMGIVAAALAGSALPWAFIFKIIFTSITLGSGYRGGEIVPVFFTGATFGCVAASFLGLPPGFGAALGLVALFCGVTNCPITSLLLGIELFGGVGVPFFLVVSAVSYMLSGYYSLYGEQIIVYSKLKAEFAEIKAR